MVHPTSEARESSYGTEIPRDRPKLLTIPNFVTGLSLLIGLPGFLEDTGTLRSALLLAAAGMLLIGFTLRAVELWKSTRMDLPLIAIALLLVVLAFFAGLSIGQQGGTDAAPSATGPDRTSAPTPGTSRTSPTPAPTDASPGIYKNGTGELDLDEGSYAGNAFDLDSMFQSDEDGSFEDSVDIVANYDIVTGKNRAALTPVGPTGGIDSYQSCRTAVSAGKVSSLQLNKITTADQICMRTSEGRIAILTVTGLPSRSENRTELKFAAVVWNLER